MYALGIDLGTTYTAAAVWRRGRAEICQLGARSPTVPSVVVVRENGTVLTGEAAVRRAVVEPDRVAREFKRRIGDPIPVLLGGVPFSAETLTAHLLSSVVASVVERERGLPTSIVVSHPANWGRYKIDRLRRAVVAADLGVPVDHTSEPEAAAVSYARQERLEPGETVAVYDLGGGTFDAAVLRRSGTGFSLLGQPEGIEHLGGIDIDAAVFAHVARVVGGPLTDLDEDDPVAMAAVGRLRMECTQAKEALSTDGDTNVPVMLPDFVGEVRLTRAELEAMVRPSLYDSIQALQRALRSARVAPEELSAVLLVGGSSRMPLVAQLVGAELGRPIAVDIHPKHAVALGAAWLASGLGMPNVATAPATGILPQVPIEPVTPRPAHPATPPAATLFPGGDRHGVQILRPAAAAAARPEAFEAGREGAAPSPVRQPSPSAHQWVGDDGGVRTTTQRSVLVGGPVVVGVAAAVAAVLIVVATYFAAVGDRRASPPATPPEPAPTATGPMTPVAQNTPGRGLAPGGDSPLGAAPLVATPTPGRLVVGVTLTGRGGAVTSHDGLISCPGSCTARYRLGETVTLVARGPRFLGWTSCRHPQGATCRITGSGTALPVARFRTSVVASPTSSGSASESTTTSTSSTTSTGPSTGSSTDSTGSTGSSTSTSPGTSATSTSARTSSSPAGPSTGGIDRCAGDPWCGLAATATAPAQQPSSDESLG